MRFTLQTLLLSFVVVWTSMAVFGAVGFVLALAFLGAVGYVRVAKSKFQAIAVVGLIVLLILCLLPAFQAPIVQNRLSYCLNNLKQIELALQNYHDDHGRFPPAYIADSNGKPMHSWRVLILPYMEQQALYDLYDFNEAWDGPNNSKLATQRPVLFACSTDASTAGATTTSYVAVVGPKTMWPSENTVDFDAIADGAGNTIHVVEVLDSGIDWMEPKDLSVEDAIGGVNPSSGSGISGGHEFEIATFRKSGANVSFVDGSIGSFGNDVPGDVLEAFFTRDGGEKIDRAKYDLIARKARERERQRSIWWFALAALVASVVLLLVRPRRREELERLEPPGNAVPGR